MARSRTLEIASEVLPIVREAMAPSLMSIRSPAIRCGSLRAASSTSAASRKPLSALSFKSSPGLGRCATHFATRPLAMSRRRGPRVAAAIEQDEKIVDDADAEVESEGAPACETVCSIDDAYGASMCAPRALWGPRRACGVP